MVVFNNELLKQYCEKDTTYIYIYSDTIAAMFPIHTIVNMLYVSQYVFELKLVSHR